MEMSGIKHEINKVAIIGAGEMGLQAMHYASLCSGRFDIAGFIDDTRTAGQLIGGKPVLGRIDEVEKLYASGVFDSVFIAIGYNHLAFKQKLIDRLLPAVPMVNIVSPDAYVDSTATLGCNVMIYPGCIIDKNVRLGNGVTLNLGCIVSHDTAVGSCCFFAPGVIIAGFSSVGDRCFMGVGTKVIDNLEICDDVYTGAGAVVVKDISTCGQYIGLPAVKTK